ncbi:TIGR01906 family membrane protein, partial [Clostridium perfringens]
VIFILSLVMILSIISKIFYTLKKHKHLK